MIVHSHDFEQIIKVLRPVHGINFVQSRKTSRYNRADYSRHVGVLNQAGCVPAPGADTEVNSPPEIKG